MKKILYIIILLLCIPFAVNALEIKSLGFKSDKLDDIEFVTRDNTNNSYFFYVNNIYAFGENDRYKVYIRAVENPVDHDYTPEADIIDDVFGVINRVNTNQYSYITTNQLKWIRVIYKADNDIPLLEYYLSYKKVFITITIESKESEFRNEDINTLDEFAYSVKLTGEGQAEISHVDLNGIDKKSKGKYIFIIIESIICIFAIGITLFVTKKGK